MRLSVLLYLFACAVACNKPPPAPPVSPEVRVYGELVECGALAPYDAGPAAVAQEHAIGDMQFLSCMWDGGAPKACGAPCAQ